MCGIGSFVAMGRTLGENELRILLNGAVKRGRDGFGYKILRPGREDYLSMSHFLTVRQEDIDACCVHIAEAMEVGDVLLYCARSTPETEQESNKTRLQPIGWKQFSLVHNGCVTESDVKRYQEKYEVRQGELDSVTILKAYHHFQRDMVRAIEDLSGSFSVAGYDAFRNMHISVTGFTPLAHAFIKGVGYFTHSDNEVLGELLESMGRVNKDGISVWEAWYHHDIEPYTVIETDLESGFQQFRKYTPKFLHPSMLKKSDGTELPKKPMAVVVASGGIDSGVTAMVLKKLGYDVTLLHFSYGQKAEDSEHWAVWQLSQRLEVALCRIPLWQLYKELIWDETSLLLDSKQDATITGGDMLKSTIAWVPGRNALFATLAMTYAENLILAGKTDKVYIAAGWNQLSEETGGYPDNSYMFNKTLDQMRMCGFIAGSKIEFVPVLQRLSKTETWQLGEYMGFPFEYTVSCDNPGTVFEGNKKLPALCPDCGSTKMSIIAAARAGVKDTRRFTHPPPDSLTRQQVRKTPIEALVGALRLPVGNASNVSLVERLKKV